jgi:hypothetical protein
MIYRPPQDADYPGMQALDLELCLTEDSGFAALPERERAGRLRTSLPALRFYSRSEHSFVSTTALYADPDVPTTVYGFVLAQSVWMGDKPILWISSVRVHPDAPAGCLAGLLHAVTKSAMDSAVYEVHLAADAALEAVAHREGYRDAGHKHLVRHLGSRHGVTLERDGD